MISVSIELKILFYKNGLLRHCLETHHVVNFRHLLEIGLFVFKDKTKNNLKAFVQQRLRTPEFTEIKQFLHFSRVLTPNPPFIIQKA